MPGNQSNVLINIKVQGAKAKKALKEINGSFLAIAGTLVLLGRDISKTAAAFESSLRNINAVAQQSDKTLEKMGDRIREISKLKEIKDTAQGVSDAVNLLVRSGHDVSKSLDLAAVASKAATAGLTETKTAVKGISSLMNAYNQKTLQDSINFSDQMFKVVEQGVLSFEDLSNNLGTVNAVAASVNVGFKEVGAGFIELTRAGVSASESQTALANLLRSVAGASDETKEKAKAMGFELGDVALQSKGLHGVLQDLSKATGGSLTEMQKFIPEARAAKAALTLAKDGAKNYEKSLKEMDKATEGAGATQKSLNQQTKTFEFEMANLKATLEDLKIEWGLILNDAIRPVIPYLKQLIGFFRDMDDDTKKLIIQTALFTGGVAALGLAFKALMFTFGPLLKVASGINIQIVAATAAFYAINKAVEAAAESSSPLIQALGKILKYLDLIGTAKEAIETIRSINHANKQQEAIEKERAQALKTVQELRKREREGIALESVELKKLSKAYTILSVNARGEGKKRNRDLAIEYNKRAALVQKDLEDTRKAEKKKKLETVKTTQEKNNEILASDKIRREKEKEAEEEAARKIETLRDNLKTFSERLNDNYNKATMDDRDYRVNLLEEEKQTAIDLLDEGLKNKLISQEQHSAQVVKLNKTTREKIEKINKDANEKAEKEREKQYKKQEKERAEQLKAEVKNLGQKEEYFKQAVEIEMKSDFDAIEKRKTAFSQALASRKLTQEEAFKENQAILNQEAEAFEMLAFLFKDNEELKTEAKKQAAQIRTQITANETGNDEKLFRDHMRQVRAGIGALGELGSELKKSNNEIIQSVGDLASETAATASDAMRAVSNPLEAIKLGVKELGESIREAGEAWEFFQKAGADGEISSQEWVDGINKAIEAIPFIGDIHATSNRAGEAIGTGIVNMFGLMTPKQEKLLDETVKKLKKAADDMNADIIEKERVKNQEISKLKAELIDDEIKQREALIKIEIAEINATVKNETIKALKKRKIEKDFQKWKAEQEKKALKKKTEATKKANEEIRKDLEKGFNILQKAYDKELNLIKKKYKTENGLIDKNIKKIREQYRTEADKIKEINALLNKDKNDQAQRKAVFSEFSGAVADRSDELGPALERTPDAKQQELNFDTRSADIQKQYETGKINAKQRAELDKKLALDKFIYFDRLAQANAKKSEGRRERSAQAENARKEFFEIRLQELSDERERKKLESDKIAHEKKLTQLSEQYDKEIENARTIDKRYSDSLSELNGNLRTASNNFKAGMIDAAQAFGNEVNKQVNKVTRKRAPVEISKEDQRISSTSTKELLKGANASDIDARIEAIKRADAAAERARLSRLGRSFATGTAQVKKDGPANVHKGEMILPKKGVNNAIDLFNRFMSPVRGAMGAQAGGGNTYIAQVNGSNLGPEQLENAIYNGFQKLIKNSNNTFSGGFG